MPRPKTRTLQEVRAQNRSASAAYNQRREAAGIKQRNYRLTDEEDKAVKAFLSELRTRTQK